MPASEGSLHPSGPYLALCCSLHMEGYEEPGQVKNMGNQRRAPQTGRKQSSCSPGSPCLSTHSHSICSCPGPARLPCPVPVEASPPRWQEAPCFPKKVLGVGHTQGPSRSLSGQGTGHSRDARCDIRIAMAGRAFPGRPSQTRAWRSARQAGLSRPGVSKSQERTGEPFHSAPPLPGLQDSLQSTGLQ